MHPSIEVTRGIRVLRRLLAGQVHDLRTLDLAHFRCWLEKQLRRWQNDPVFVQRLRIRDLRRTCPRLRLLEVECHRAAQADAAAPAFPRLAQLERELRDTDKAIAGLSRALAEGPTEKRPALRRKLDRFQARQQSLHREQVQMLRSCPQRQTLLRLREELQRLRADLGLEQAEEQLQALLRKQGQRSHRSGISFEQVALELTQRVIVPDLLRHSSIAAAGRVRILRGVTLGAARTEFDQLVVRLPRHSGWPVEVLALVEVKRNLNDLAHGFRLRQENLAWLIGATDRYQPRLYRTRHFRSGHFDRPARHDQDGEAFVFDRGSFRLFRRAPDSDWILNRFYLMTRPGMMWGVSTATLARLQFRVATDERWQPDCEDYLRELLHGCQALAQPIETPDVLRLYSGTARRARQVLLVGPAGGYPPAGDATPLRGRLGEEGG